MGDLWLASFGAASLDTAGMLAERAGIAPDAVKQVGKFEFEARCTTAEAGRLHDVLAQRGEECEITAAGTPGA